MSTRGFEYSLVVLVLGSEYLSTTIEYSPYKIECFVSTHHIFCEYSGGVFVKYSYTYFVQYPFTRFNLFISKTNDRTVSYTIRI